MRRHDGRTETVDNRSSETAGRPVRRSSETAAQMVRLRLTVLVAAVALALLGLPLAGAALLTLNVNGLRAV